MRQLIYFAYGSNMLIDQLEYRVGHIGPVVKIGTHKLMGYRLVFNTRGFANIIHAEPNSYVEGVLYSLNSRQFKELDMYEGLYTREIFDLPNGQLGAVYVGLKSVSDWRMKPRLDYINTVLDGALTNGLKDTYNNLVDYKLSSFKLKKGNRHKKIV